MPTREFTEEEKKEAREAGERVKMECEHSNASGECLEYKEMCYYEDQKKCPKYSPKHKQGHTDAPIFQNILFVVITTF